MKLILAVLVVVVSIQAAPSPIDEESILSDFCYDEDFCGPDSALWDGQCKTGNNQSPIDLPKYSVSTRVQLDFNNQYRSNDFFILNNGHTIQVSLLQNVSSSALISGYGFTRPYTLAQIHFHWGYNTTWGSEHTVDSVHYAMEVHLVHYDSKYANFSMAVASQEPTALAVVGIFVEPGTEEDENLGFDTIASNLPIELHPEPIQVDQPLDLSSFLPTQGQNFYRYNGSLTTPSCDEIVAWTVIQQPIYVQPSEILKFWEVESAASDHHPIGLNVRPLQNSNQRNIQYLTKL